MLDTHTEADAHIHRACYTLQSNIDGEPVCFPSVSPFQFTELFSVFSAGGISVSLNWFVTVPLPFWSPWHKNTNMCWFNTTFFRVFFGVYIKTVGSTCNNQNLWIWLHHVLPHCVCQSQIVFLNWINVIGNVPMICLIWICCWFQAHILYASIPQSHSFVDFRKQYILKPRY